MSKMDRTTSDASAPGACAGRSIMEIVEDALDEVFAALKQDDGADVEKTHELRGQAQGLSLALAIFRNPYSPNVNQEKANAVVRWESAQEVEEAEAGE